MAYIRRSSRPDVFYEKGVNIFQLKWLILEEAVAQMCSMKKVFLEISQNSQENTCARVSILIKLQALPTTFLKKRLWHRCFFCEFCKISKNTFFYRTPLVVASILVNFRHLNFV